MPHSSDFEERKMNSRYHENELGHGQFELTRETDNTFQRGGYKSPPRPPKRIPGAGSTVVTQVTADTREEIFQNQREAALRRRKQQFQSGFIGNNNNRMSMLSEDRSFAHSVKNFSPVEEDRNSRSYGDSRSFVTKGSVHRDNDYSSPNSRRSCEYPGENQNGSNHRNFPEENLFQRRREPPMSSHLPECISVTEGCSITSKNLLETDSNQGFDDQTFISDLSEHRSGDKARTSEVNRRGRRMKSPTTLSNMIGHGPDDDKRRSLQAKTKLSADDTYDTDDSTEDDDANADAGERKDEKPLVETRDIKKREYKFSESIDWENIKEVKNLLVKPVPKSAGMVQCYIKRNKGTSRFLPEYRIYLKDGDRFLMTSKKRKKKKTANYLISLGRNDHNKGSERIIGKLRSNFMGTEFQIYDDGKNPKHQDPFYDEKNEDPVRSELGAILYGSNFGTSRGPRNMQVCINKIRKEGECTKQWQPAHKDESMIQCFKYKTEPAMRHLLYLENRRPKWNEDMCAYVLNFSGRVTMASVKNFQLINQTNDNDNEKVIMQFGRTGNNEFIMDVQWPMSIFQAFAISMSSCDSKLACD
jgi:tubby-related protein 1